MLYHHYTNRRYVNTAHPNNMLSEYMHFYVDVYGKQMRQRNENKVHFNNMKHQKRCLHMAIVAAVSGIIKEEFTEHRTADSFYTQN